MEDYIPSSSSSSNTGLGHIMPQQRTRKKKKKKEERIRFMIINHYPLEMSYFPFSAPAVIVVSAALVGVLFYT